MKKILLKGGTVVSAEGQTKQDVLIEGEKIAQIAENVEGDFDEIIDVSGKYVLPGAIDAHVHLREPGGEHKEDYETGSKAAVAGGVTSVLDMPNTSPPTTTKELVEAKYALARAKAVAHVGLFALAVPETIDEVLKLDNIAGVKIYLGASTGGHEEDLSFLEEIFAKSGEKVIVVHAEDGACIARHAKEFEGQTDPAIHSKIRASECAAMSTKEVCHLAKKHNARVHIAHMSTAEEVETMRKFKSDRITCEVTPHHLFLNTSHYSELGNKMRVNPPVREQKDESSLWQAIHDGIVDMVATDHAPHTIDEKTRDYWKAPSGMPGLETMIPLLLNEVNKENLSLMDVVRLTAKRPAEVFGLEGKGELKEGNDADVLVVDLEEKRAIDSSKLYTKCAWSPFEGWEIQGWPLMTFVSGELACESQKVLKVSPAETLF